MRNNYVAICDLCKQFHVIFTYFSQTTPQSTLGPPAHETATTNIMTSSNSVYIATAVSSANVRVPTHGTTTSSTRPLSDAGSYVDIDGYTPMFPNH